MGISVAPDASTIRGRNDARGAGGSPRKGARRGVVSRAAWLYDQWGVAAFSLCVAITGDRQVAADIIVECCATAPEGAADNEGAWLVGEARRRAIAVAGLSGAARGADLDSVSQPFRIFETLNDEQRQTLGLAYYGGLRVSQVAERLEVPTAHVLEVLTSALEQIRAAGGVHAQTLQQRRP